MAMEKCKECGAQISGKAAACPSCGHPIKRTSLTVKLIAIFIGLAVLSSIIESCSDKPEPVAEKVVPLTPEQRAAEKKEMAEQAIRDQQATAAQACRMFILKGLKDPDSAKFEYTNYQAPSKKNQKGIYEVQHKVRAKNSFGAYNLSYFNCQLRQTKDNKDWLLVSIKEVH